MYGAVQTSDDDKSTPITAVRWTLLYGAVQTSGDDSSTPITTVRWTRTRTSEPTTGTHHRKGDTHASHYSFRNSTGRGKRWWRSHPQGKLTPKTRERSRKIETGLKIDAERVSSEGDSGRGENNGEGGVSNVT